LIDTIEKISESLKQEGFYIKNTCFSTGEMEELLRVIEQSKKLENKFAIRQFFEAIPSAKTIIFNKVFTPFLAQHFEKNYFLIKAIYFDKPPTANWIVPWHQDLTIVTNQKAAIDGFSKWRLKKDAHYVQPPTEILENIVTIRIHLDDCTRNNGALRVIPASHQNGIDKKLDYTQEKSVICEVKKDGLLFMKPLLFHASKRTTNHLNRRVVHLEFATKALPLPLTYRERIDFSCRNL